jgi:methylated-DNA-[protein]-cysteine S-methyltransferase
MRYCLFETEIGLIGLAWTAQGLTRLQLPEKTRDATERRLRSRCPDAEASPAGTAPGAAAELLSRYAAGERSDFSGVPLDLTGVDDFGRSIYRAARAVVWGETTTYGALAKQIGAPDAARAVGGAMGRNPLPIIIPCHRVLASGGKSGGFSAFGGVLTKERLLALEGVYLGGGTPLLPGLIPSQSHA